MKTIILIVIVITLNLLNAWIQRETEKNIDEFVRKEHERNESDA